MTLTVRYPFQMMAEEPDTMPISPVPGDFSGWPFSDVDHPLKPFRQIDTYLHIAARKEPGTNGATGI